MRLISKELCELTGLKPSAVSNYIRRKQLVKCTNKLIDIKDPKNRRFLTLIGIDMISVLKKAEKKKMGITSPKISHDKETENEEEFTQFEAISGLPDKMMNLTIKQLISKYKDFNGLKNYVDILDKLMSARKKDIDALEKRRELIPRSFFEYLRSYINTLNNQLFDYAESCITDIISLVKSDEKKAKFMIPETLRKNFSKYMTETLKRIEKDIRKMDQEIERPAE